MALTSCVSALVMPAGSCESATLDDTTSINANRQRTTTLGRAHLPCGDRGCPTAGTLVQEALSNRNMLTSLQVNRPGFAGDSVR